MQYEEREALFVFEPGRERQCFAIRSNCKRVASHLTRPHWSHHPNLASTHTHHHSGASKPDTNQGSGFACLDPVAGACPWPHALPRDPCSKQVRSNGLPTSHYISQFPSTHAPVRVALGLSVSLHMESATTTPQQLWNADSSTALATSPCFVCSHHFPALRDWQIIMDDAVHTCLAMLPSVAGTAASLDSSTHLTTKSHVGLPWLHG